jgi:hypothetical protein
MPLENTCHSTVGSLVFVLPIIGFGWSELKRGGEFPDEVGIDPPEPFCVRITKFHCHENQIRGAIGTIEQDGHSLNGKWAAFCARDGGGGDFYNLTTKPTKHNVRIGGSEPVIEVGGDSVPMVEWIQFEGVDVLSGIGYVAESIDWIREVFERIQRSKG